MGRLTELPHRLRAAPPRLARAPVAEPALMSRFRDEMLPWRKWYKTARWQKLRWSVLVRDLFTCKRCKRLEANTSRLVADHIVPHRGDEVMFWDSGNLQSLCKPCHDGPKQAAERAGRW